MREYWVRDTSPQPRSGSENKIDEIWSPPPPPLGFGAGERERGRERDREREREREREMKR